MFRLSRPSANIAVKSSRAFSKFKLPDLSYDYGALEPVISAEIMQLHHSKHHNAYVTNLNVALAKLEESQHKNDVSGVIAQQAAIRFNGGIFRFLHHV